MKCTHPDISMSKFLKKIQARGFFEIDILNYPAGQLKSPRITNSKFQKLVIERMKRNLKSKLPLIDEVSHKDTVIFMVKKSTYDLLYPELSGKYTIANDILEKEFGKKYMSNPTGHQKEFRIKLKKCLDILNYQFETDFSDVMLK